MSKVTNEAGGTWGPETIRDLVTIDRLSSYLNACGGELVRAIDLYEWNLSASAAVMKSVAMVEVVVRNTLDAQLVALADARWSESWFNAAPLDSRGKNDVRKALSRATTNGREPLVHGKVVAELSFGFWRYLTAQRYHASLWVPALNSAFPYGSADIRQRRRDVEFRLGQLMLVRNRAAHHEPIHRRDLSRDLDSATELCAWIHPHAGLWVAQTSSIPLVVRSKPADATYT